MSNKPANHGTGTTTKQNRYRELLAFICLYVASLKIPFNFVDLTAGPGWWNVPEGIKREKLVVSITNSIMKANCTGSPLMARSVADYYRKPSIVTCFENDRSNFESLERNTKLYTPVGDYRKGKFKLHYADFETAVDVLANDKDMDINSKFGMFYMDPPNIPNFDVMSKLSYLCKNFDLVFNINCSAIKRSRSRISQNTNKTTLKEYLSLIDRKHTYVTEVNTGWHWMMVYMTNRTIKHEFNLFRNVESAQGQEWLNRGNCTNQELVNS